MKDFLTILGLLCGFCFAQYSKTLVGNTNSFDATAFNNGHKIAVKYCTKFVNDTIHVVYYSSDSLFYVLSTDEGNHWQPPVYLGKGAHPAIDLDRLNRRHIVYEHPDTNGGSIDIYYYCLDDTISPRKVNLSNRVATLPDVVIDSTLMAHIVWEEDVDGRKHIYYRSCVSNSFGDTLRLSNYSNPQENNTSPSISIFEPNKRIYVLWSAVDSSSCKPFRIYYRYNEMGVWSDIILVDDNFRTLRNPSLDYSHGSDSLSACWEDSSTGNLEARFYGGTPGGGYSTSGSSRYPVISTVGLTWSYLYWDEDSSEFKDICCHLYYCMSGWYERRTIRNLFSINESVRYPNACGAYVIWTQGDTPPYKVYFANFGYPIAVDENLLRNAPPKIYAVYPNPFTTTLNIRCLPSASVKIYSANGRLIRSFPVQHFTDASVHSIIWDGTDNFSRKLPSGVYFIYLDMVSYKQAEKVILLR